MPKRSDVPGENYGEKLKYDPNFNGPIHRRSCTDVICLLLFVVFVGVWIAVGVFAIKNGDINRILVPTDSNGLKCGMDSGVEDKPYLVFFDMVQCLSPGAAVKGCPTPQVCVKSCPKETLLKFQIQKGTDMRELRDKIVCKVDPNTIANTDQLFKLMENSECAEHVFKSTPVFGRCFGDLAPLVCKETSNKSPETESKTTNNVKRIYDGLIGGISNILFDERKKDNAITNDNNNDKQVCIRNTRKVKLMARTTPLDAYIGFIIANIMSYFLEDPPVEIGIMVIEDLVNYKWLIVASVAIVMIICLIYITLMRWIAAPMVWFSIFAVIGILTFSIYLSYIEYAKAENVSLQPSQTNIVAAAKSIFSQQSTWLIILIIVSVFDVVIILSIIFLRKRIVIAIALIKEGSKAVSSITTTLFFPIFPWISQCLVVAAAIVFSLYLYSIGEPKFQAVFPNSTTSSCTCAYKNGDICVPEQFNKECLISGCMDAVCHFIGIESPMYIRYMFVLTWFGFFWLIFFIEGLGEMILASTFATWYWTFNKSNVPFFTLLNGVCRTLRYHLGTIAFGSLIIAICRFIRVCLEYLDHKLKKYDNTITRAIMCCMRCFFKCLESFLRFINKNAYIMCAVHGKGFLSSAKDAFSLLMRNIIRVFVLDKVTSFLFFLSKIVVSVGCGAAAYYAFKSSEITKISGASSALNYDLVPPIIISVVAYFISSIFFAIYSMAVDTLFLCFLEDCERNDGTPEKPYFMSKQLLKILGKRNKLD